MHKTDNLDDGYMGSGVMIKRAINKYGAENFSKEILYVFDNENDMKNKEKELVVISENTYNLCPGGHGGFGYINKQGLNLINLSGANLAIKKKWYEDKEYREETYSRLIKMRKVGFGEKRLDWTGRKHKPETIEKMKLSFKGKQSGARNSQYGTCWITNGNDNKKVKKEELDFWLSKGYTKGRVV